MLKVDGLQESSFGVALCCSYIRLPVEGVCYPRLWLKKEQKRGSFKDERSVIR